MAWLLGLLLFLLLLALALLIALPELEGRELRAPRLTLEPLFSWLRDSATRIRDRSRPDLPERDWQESDVVPDEEQRQISWQERLRGRMQDLLQASPQQRVEQAQTQAPPASRAPSASKSRRPMAVFLIALLAIALLIAFLVERYIPTERAHRLTIIVADLATDEQMLPSTTGAVASEELRDYLEENLAQRDPELASLLRLGLVHETPSNPAAAYNLARQIEADLLLWGRVRPGETPAYLLHLAINPRFDREVPEFAEYLQVMATPHDVPLFENEAEAGVPPETLVELLAWLSGFYLGQFEEIDDLSLEGVALPAPAAELLDLHRGGVQWLGGRYGEAEATYEELLGLPYREVVGPALEEIEAGLSPCSDADYPQLCAAASNNRAVVTLTEEALGELDPSALGEAIQRLSWAAAALSDPLVQYNLGRAHLRRNNDQEAYQAAIDALRLVVVGEEDHAPAMAALSAAYRHAGNGAEAERWAENAISADRSLAEGYVALGLTVLQQGDTGRASRVLRRAQELAEEESSRRRSRETALREGPEPNPDRAEYAAAWARRNEPALGATHLAQARLYLVLGQREGRPSLVVDLWRTLTRQPGPLDQALSEVDTALVHRPNWYTAYYLRGEIYLQRGTPDLAIPPFEQARDLDRGNRQAYLGLADAYLRQWRNLHAAGSEDAAQEKLDLARQQYQTLVDQEIDPARGYFGLGEIAWEIENYADAQEAFLNAVGENEEYAEAYLWLGRVALKLDQEENALGYFEQAIETTGRYYILVTAHTERGQVYLEQYLRSKRTPPAEHPLLEQAHEDFQAGGEIPSALSGLGRVAYEEGDHERAEELFERVLRGNRNNFGAHYGLGRVYEAQERSRQARDHLRRAVDLRPDSIAAHYHLGVAYYAQLQEYEALRAFRRVEELCRLQADRQRRESDDIESCEEVASWLERLGEEPAPLPTEEPEEEAPTPPPTEMPAPTPPDEGGEVPTQLPPDSGAAEPTPP